MPSDATVRVGSHDFRLAYVDLLRPLSATERQALKNSIRKHGVLVPVLTDEEGNVIDGANRVLLAAELGLKNLPVQVRTQMTPEGKVELAFSLNDARRHLTPAEREQYKKERVERTKKAREAGQSTRAIADAEGVSHPQVLADLQAPSSGGKDLPPEQNTERSGGKDLPPEHAAAPPKVTGRDKKSYPARVDPERTQGRRERVAGAKKAGKTVRQIAAEEGVSLGTVQADIQKAGATPATSTPPDQPRQTEPAGCPTTEQPRQTEPAGCPTTEQPRQPAISAEAILQALAVRVRAASAAELESLRALLVHHGWLTAAFTHKEDTTP